MAQHCKKGQRIGIEGHLQQRTWEDNNGYTRQVVEIVVDNFNFLSSTKPQMADGSAKEIVDDFEGEIVPDVSLENAVQYDGEF